MMPQSRWFRVILASLLFSSVLVVSVLACAGHDHGANPSRRCEVCHFGHMPSVQAASIAQVLPPAPREWRQAAEEAQQFPQPAPPETPSRAPPV
jgi:hypothetical protein